jgi:hypothetical protein
MPEEDSNHEEPNTDNVSKANSQEEKSTVDSPPKATLEDTHQSPTKNDMTNQWMEALKRMIIMLFNLILLQKTKRDNPLMVKQNNNNNNRIKTLKTT